MATEGKNFTGQDTPSIVDTEYVGCNFYHGTCIDTAGVKTGHRLFPGDDTPRVFRGCNLVNCETPPGSTLDTCNTWIMDCAVVFDTDLVEVDGEEVGRIDHHQNAVYRKWTEGGYEDHDFTVELD